MFSWIKKNRFENKVNEFRQMITNDCIKEYRKDGLLDEMYTISICKVDGESIVADAKVEEDGGIIINFHEGIGYDVCYTVVFSSVGTIVSYLGENFELKLLESDPNNEEMLFSKYIDLFLDVYKYDAHKKILRDLEIDFSNQPVVFREIVNYIQENANLYQYENRSAVYYCLEGDYDKSYEFYICLNRNAGLLEIRSEMTDILEDTNELLTLANVVEYDYKNRIARSDLADKPSIETEDIEGVNYFLSFFYEEFKKDEKEYLDGKLVI